LIAHNGTVNRLPAYQHGAVTFPVAYFVSTQWDSE
jgi:hypothetical protein